MEIKYGLISSDSHGQLDRYAYSSRMSKSKWGERIPHVIEVRDEKYPEPVERWIVNGEIQGGNVCNCPTAMPNRSYYPQRWMEDLGFGWEQMPNFKVHSEADEEHSDMFLEDLERFATGEKEQLVYRAAKESMELLKIFRYGISREMEKFV